MRLFIAVNFSDEIKNSLLRYIDDLKKASLSGNFTRKENLHLTLAFIGETSRVSAVKACIDSVPFEAFPLSLYGSGRFGDLWWVGIKKEPRLSVLAEDLCESLREKGFKIEKRAFKPHITAARELKTDGEIRSREVTAASMTVKRISLMKSERINGRLVYTEIYGRNAE